MVQRRHLLPKTPSSSRRCKAAQTSKSHVFFDGKYKVVQSKGIEPGWMARLLLIDLVSGL